MQPSAPSRPGRKWECIPGDEERTNTMSGASDAFGRPVGALPELLLRPHLALRALRRAGRHELGSGRVLSGSWTLTLTRPGAAGVRKDRVGAPVTRGVLGALRPCGSRINTRASSSNSCCAVPKDLGGFRASCVKTGDAGLTRPRYPALSGRWYHPDRPATSRARKKKGNT